MPEAIRVRVERPKSIGDVRFGDICWDIQPGVIEQVNARCGDWGNSQKIATAIANSISLDALKKKIFERKKEKSTAGQFAVDETLILSLPKRTRERFHVELRVVDKGVIEIHPRSMDQVLSKKKAAHA